MVRSALMGVLVMVLAIACARPNPTVQLPPPLPTPTPSPSPTPTAPLQATTAPFHAGEVGAGYAPVTLSATGGVQPYMWSISAGALPGGLSLSSDGNVTGTPASPGSFHFTVQVADAGGSTTTLPATIGIADGPHAHLNANCAGHCSAEVGCVNVCGDFGSLTGGTGPFTFTWSGDIPIGVHVQGFSLQGTFTTVANYWQFEVAATDAFGETASVSPVFLVFPHISVGASATCGPIYFRIGCTSTFAYSGGTPGGTPSARVTNASGTLCTQTLAGGYVCGPTTSLPLGFSTSAGGGKLIVSVPADPNGPYYTWAGTITMVLTDQSLCAVSTRCTSGAATLTVDLNGG